VAEDERWPAHLVAQLRDTGLRVADPEYVARTAWTTDELMDAVDAARPEGPYDLVTLLIGVNDQYRARSLTAFGNGFKPCLLRAIKLAGGKPKRVVVLSIPYWGSTPFAAGRDTAAISRDIDAYNDHARSVTLDRRAAWVDVTVPSREMLRDRSLAVEDGLHPSGELYRRWAALAAPAARAALAR